MTAHGALPLVDGFRHIDGSVELFMSTSIKQLGLFSNLNAI